ncbi:MAG TPA: magnesium transporter CorA family protein [Armatimonadota bacterium]|nr:magnesium transporter CorA family protein [Armatimonadota bacterium]
MTEFLSGPSPLAPPADPPAEAPAETPAQITVWLSRRGQAQCLHLDPARISDVLEEEEAEGGGALLWVDVRDPSPAELEMLHEEFGFHRLALEDAAKQKQRPKVDEYPGYFFVVMYAPLPGDADKELETAEIDMFVGKNYVVTLHDGAIPALDEAKRRWPRTEAALREQVGFLLHVIADSVIDAYFPVVDTIEDKLDDLELAMFTAKTDFNPEQLLAVKRTLYTLRKAIYPLREVFNLFLRRDQMIFSPETYPYFQDAYDHVLRLLDIIDIERDMATGVLEAQLSVVSNRLNETMRRLTVITICVAIMGAVFGAWGMNFSAVPLHDMGLLGFAIVTGGTLVLVALVLVIAKHYNAW